MAQKLIGIRGLDPLLYEQLIEIVENKYGKRRGKHSNVARELNGMIRQYIEHSGTNITHTHKSKKEAFREALEDAVRKRGPTEAVVRDVLYAHGRPSRTLAQWVDYSKDFMNKIVAEETKMEVNRLKYKDVPGYR